MHFWLHFFLVLFVSSLVECTIPGGRHPAAGAEVGVGVEAGVGVVEGKPGAFQGSISPPLHLREIHCSGLALLASPGLDQGSAPGVALRGRLAHLQGSCVLIRPNVNITRHSFICVFNITGGLAA